MRGNKNNKRSTRRKKEILRNRIIFFGIIACLVGGSVYGIHKYKTYKSEKAAIAKAEEEKAEKKKAEEEKKREEEERKKREKREVLLTFAGDFTLGTDTNFNQSTSLPAAVQAAGNDYSYLLKNVREIFENDDYTLVNLETTFTDATEKKDKGAAVQFHFKGPSSYAKILTSSSIEGVTVANNHIYDYGEKGFKDTINTLKNNNVDITGEGYKIVKDIKGIKFGFLGYQAWDNGEKIKNKIKEDITKLKEEGVQVIIPYFHWGIERDTTPASYQVDLAHYAIDLGADMVLGSHPHVIQSLENYKSKLIAYSLGNFCFGGNSNPSDKRTFILRGKLNFLGDELQNIDFKVIPASISSVSSKNDYVPTPLNGDSGKSILDFMNSLSPTLKGEISNKYFKLN